MRADMLLQVCTHARQVSHRSNPALGQMATRPDAREHQQSWRVERACAQGHAELGTDLVLSSCAINNHTNSAAILDQNTPHRAFHADFQI